ncbi:hypothetical protein JKA74_14950 [Marivirga sp. S37H4]|uniref:Fluoroacetyl-CoA-specific thioesterase-like domain-containing protein n=1 Tax=Marivirga aurantiaca TaxID=2802615 RepID=A0A934X0Z7_9BACT|nr:hypothetical protein [Marivirga aurantiaca]MBK6266341.1 hypothetical protein [Marivirga aurantiaca]
MRDIFQRGDEKSHSFIVKEKDVAEFDVQKVHSVCATFTLAKEIEWCTRLFVLDMLEIGEEGIGTSLNIQHRAPALIGEEVTIVGKFERIEEKEILCSFVARVNQRVVATGETGQRILPKEKIAAIFEKIKNK